MALDSKPPIVIKKINKGEHGHHGGAWKIAYADFVTAMMAFFLLMWLLGSTTEAQKKGIADFFENPYKVSMNGGRTSGDTTSVLQGGGPDITHDIGQLNMGDTQNERDFKGLDDGDEQVLEALNRELRQAIESSQLLNEFRDQLKIDFTRDGLRIQLVDAQNRPMFPLGSERLEPYSERILAQLTPLLAKFSNRISIIGHTDATPFVANGRDYSNWELSAGRANAARRAMLAAGFPARQVARVSGMASVAPFDQDNPRAEVNRRIAILVLNRRADQELWQQAAGEPLEGPDGLRLAAPRD